MFCNAWKVKNPEELDTETAKKIVSELGDIGVSILGITGGEPLIRRDLEERSWATYFVSEKTTGHLKSRDNKVHVGLQPRRFRSTF